ncbi:uncharacterized protein [Chelonus insularis]|uniref:uncharacterized protein n=1 Tax=Chelonus insularis TaxID=460826 RepID=UPI00158A8A64|nr:uncharacterized protein LOC118064783 [Chelonus insularis]
MNEAVDIVKRVAKSVLNSGKNITMDNWFNTISLIKDLSNNHKITIVDTLRKNKRKLPLEFINIKNRIVYSSLFGFHDVLTVVSYVPKADKNVLMGSSMHLKDEINKNCAKKKPGIINFYNLIKDGVDVADKLKSAYRVSR